MQQKWNKLYEYAREIYDLQSIRSLLAWDQSTYMPSRASASRGKQLATLSKHLQDCKSRLELGELLSDLAQEALSLPYDSDQASLHRVMHRDYEKDVKVPTEFIARCADHCSRTHAAWEKARAENDFKQVEPYLKQSLELSKEYANFFPGYEHLADPLIDDADYGCTAASIKKLFGELREQLVPLVDEASSKPVDDAFLFQGFDEADQLKFGEYVIKLLGFDFERGRQDLTAHPFMIRFAHDDVRITTRVKENNFGEALFGSIHEAGHAMYEQGIAYELEGTALHAGTSSGVHESQSRLWENIVGRSYGFWQHFYPKLQSEFPTQLGNISLQQFYQAINKVSRSLIRTDADELTYNLHVIIRFDLELAMLEGNLSVSDLADAWRQRYQSDLGISSPTDQDGVLQDIHWYSGLIGGGFQCYTLGNILSCQFYDAATRAHPEIDQQIREGKFSVLHSWLRDNIYKHGSKFTADELTERATGQALHIEPYIKYLRGKFA